MSLARASALVALAVLAGCSPQTPASAPADTATATTAAAPAAASAPAPDGHSSRDSVDWAGRYTGTLPCASCPGIDTVLTLAADGSYTLEETYREQADGKMKPAKGKFTWSADGSTVTLDDAADGAVYKVGEGQLFRLDADGKEVTGPMAKDYVLTKQS